MLDVKSPAIGDGVCDLAVYDGDSRRWYIRSMDGRVLATALNWGSSSLSPVGVAPLY